MSLELSLYKLDADLTQLWAMREDAEEELAICGSAGQDVTPIRAELAAIEEAMKLYFAALPKKVDSTADAWQMLDRLAGERREIKGEKFICELDREIDRLKERRDGLRKRIESLKRYLLFVMQGMEWPANKPRKLEGVRHSISLRGNGGVAPLTITDAALLPDELQDMRVTMTFAQYLELRRTVWQKYEEGIEVDGPFPSNERIRAALAKRCDHCDGAPAVGTKDECQWCSGTGCAVVPGARLDPRGETVIVK